LGFQLQKHSREKDFHPYQDYSVEWIKSRKSCALWAKMGLGKTVITLTALAELIADFEVQRVLVVAPLRVARKTWKDELDSWTHLPPLRMAFILGTAQQRLAAMRSRADIYMINRENLTWLVDQHFDVKEVLNKDGKVIDRIRGNKQIRPWIWDTVVLDESSSFKNRNSIRWGSLKYVRRLIDRMIQLSGTPSPKGLMDLWAQLWLLDRGERLGATITAFRDRWFEPPKEWGFKWALKQREMPDGSMDPWAEAAIHDRIKDVCLTLREEDYLDLPPVTYNQIRVELAPETLKEYRRMARHFVMELDGHEITAVNAGVLAGKLLQLANGAIYIKHPDWKPFHDEKLDALMELIDVSTGRIIVVYNFQSDEARITQALTKAKLNWRKLHTKKDEDDWNAGEIDVLIMHPASAGHGLNLQHSGCELMIWFGLNWSLELYQQALARLTGGHRRTGRNVVIHHIVADDTIDQRVIDVLADNNATQERLFEVTRKVIKEFKDVPA